MENQQLESELLESFRFQLKRDKLHDDFLKKMKEQYPCLESFYLGECSLQLESSMHHLKSRHADEEPEVVKMCNGKDMPESVDEFLLMSKKVKQDKKELMECFYHMRAIIQEAIDE